MEFEQEHIKNQGEFISLLLKHRDLVAEWINSNLIIDYFDPEFRRILRAIEDAAQNNVLLTSRAYQDYLVAKQCPRPQLATEEVLYSRIVMCAGKFDDYPTLKSRVIDSFVWRSSNKHIKEFNDNRDNKGNNYAIAHLADQLHALLDGVQIEKQTVFEDISDYAPEFLQYILDVRSGKIKKPEVVKCHIAEIDYAMSIGFAPGTLTLFCADVGGFKSTAMLNVAANIWKKEQKNVLFIPLEMPRKYMYQKFLSRETQISFDRLNSPVSLTDEEIQKIEKEQNSWEEMDHKFFIMEHAERTKVSVIRREIEKHIDIFKPDLVVVDYIANLIPDLSRRDRNDLEIGDMLKELRHIGGKNLEFAIVSAAQLGRDALKRLRKSGNDKMMAYSEDIRGSHEYSADADFIFALLPDPQQPKSLIHLVVVKSRYGKQVFEDGRSKAALEVRPEISYIHSREDILTNVNPDDILQKTQDDSLNFDDTDGDDKVMNIDMEW